MFLVNKFQDLWRTISWGGLVGGPLAAIKPVIRCILDMGNLRPNVTVLDEVRNRVYALIGIIMFFKLTVSFITYLFDPDLLLEKKKGVTAVLKSLFTSIAILILLPFMFNFLYRAQTVFMPVVPRLFSNNNEVPDGQTKEFDDYIDKSSDEMTAGIIRPFFRPREDNGEPVAKEIENMDDFKKAITETKGGKYAYEGNFFVAMIGAILAFIMLVFITFEVSKRVFKMLILELIAPIPVMARVSNTKGEEVFNNYIKMLTGVFLEIFIQIGSIYFMLFIMHYLNTGLFEEWGANLSFLRVAYIKVVLIIGLIMFAKEIPEFVTKALGINFNTKGLANMIGKATGALGGAATRGLGSLVRGGGLAGTAEAVLSGAKEGYQSGKGNQFGTGWEDAKTIRNFGEKQPTRAEKLHQQAIRRQLNKAGITKATLDEGKNNVEVLRDDWQEKNSLYVSENRRLVQKNLDLQGQLDLIPNIQEPKRENYIGQPDGDRRYFQDLDAWKNQQQDIKKLKDQINENNQRREDLKEEKDKAYEKYTKANKSYEEAKSLYGSDKKTFKQKRDDARKEYNATRNRLLDEFQADMRGITVDEYRLNRETAYKQGIVTKEANAQSKENEIARNSNYVVYDPSKFSSSSPAGTSGNPSSGAQNAAGQNAGAQGQAAGGPQGPTGGQSGGPQGPAGGTNP